MKIGKEFRWEMGHRLPAHTRGCQNLHGHSYRLMVELEGEPGAGGMVADYTDLKAIVKPIISKLDHAFMCDESDETVKEFLNGTQLKAVFVPFPTTAENIGTYLLRQIAHTIMEEKTRSAAWSSVTRLRLKIRETQSTYAECETSLTSETERTL